MNLYRQPRVARTVERLADWLNGPTCDAPGAITIGGMIVRLMKLTPAIERHEWMHVVQCARYCPRVLKWIPWIRARAWLGFPWFLPAYNKEHRAHGYEFNAFEIEARMAEVEP